MAAQPPRKINIAVIGGGIGGLAQVLALQHFCDMSQLDVHIYEAATHINQIGAGINIWERVCEMLSEIGLKEDIERLLRENENTPWVCRKSDEKEGVPITEIVFEEAGRMLLLHRADVQELFMKHLSPEVHIHLSHRLESYSYTDAATERIRLHFKGGEEARCDLLIAADGVHSVVRKQLLPELTKELGKEELQESAQPLFSGSKVYRDLVPFEELAKVWPGHPTLVKPHIYCGKNKHIITYPIHLGNKHFVNVVPFYTDPSKENTPFSGSQIGQATTEEVLKTYEGWEPEVQALLGCMAKPSHWAVLTLKPFETWAHRGVILLGDAAHAMVPHIGAGACEAIEDGYVLAQILAYAQKKGPLEALSDETMALYNRLRPPIANFVHERARLQGLFYEFNEEGADLGLVEKGSPFYLGSVEGKDEGVNGNKEEAKKLTKLGHGMQDGYLWWKHSIVRETDAAVKRALA
ncbi:hypothetical protein GGG16DRAFT_124909 [Schizophyllum commune]